MRRLAVVTALTLTACAGGTAPVAVDPGHDTCRFCRMPVSQPTLAAQLVAPGEEPLFFDDLGCLREFLAEGARPPDAIAFVADHRTGEWVRTTEAVFAHVASLETPMGSHLVAHRDRDSQLADLKQREHQALSSADVFDSRGADERD